MNAKEYLEGGLLLDYCLGLMKGADKAAFEQALLLYPELGQELQIMQNGLNKYASAISKEPSASTKERIMGVLDNLLLEKEMNLKKLPLINKYSDMNSWLNALKPLLPKENPEGHFIHVLTHTDTVTQVLVMTRADVPDEVHEDCYESFIILEGECECHIGDHTVVRLKAGGYMQIPLHEHHDLKIISDYVVGVMQRIAA
jgi:mannose-6-phosphate isomerase-like protein (cupin superfamily)